jgi:hypothetical protein
MRVAQEYLHFYAKVPKTSEKILRSLLAFVEDLRKVKKIVTT